MKELEIKIQVLEEIAGELKTRRFELEEERKGAFHGIYEAGYKGCLNDILRILVFLEENYKLKNK